MTEEKYQLLNAQYEKLESILNSLSVENEKIMDSFSTSNGKLLTGSLEETIHFMKKLVDNHKSLYLQEFSSDNEDLFSFLNNEDKNNE